jgi:hypothetical protein
MHAPTGNPFASVALNSMAEHRGDPEDYLWGV